MLSRCRRLEYTILAPCGPGARSGVLEWPKEALFPDVKQASFAKIKDALQHYGAADLRKTAFIDRPPTR
jgi:hypothetical protein